MACAKKCDRCGKLYEQYNSKNDRKNPNGIMVLNLDSQRRYFAHNALDLCPDCMKGFQDWFGEVKQMERLTLDEAIKHAKEVADMNYNDAEKFDSNDSVENYMKANCMECAEQHEKLAEWLEELKSYKDLEEQGLLVRLPCKVGDSLYCIVNGEVKKLKVHSFGVPAFGITDIEFKYVDGFKILRFIGKLGRTVFFTREEAEKKLEEMKNDKT